MLRFCAVLGSFLVGTAFAHADCVARYRAKPGTRSDGIVTNVKAGQPCLISVYLSSRGPVRKQLEGIEVVRQPNFGRVTVSGASFTYTANSSFAGKDSFFIRFNNRKIDGSSMKTGGVRFAVRN